MPKVPRDSVEVMRASRENGVAEAVAAGGIPQDQAPALLAVWGSLLNKFTSVLTKVATEAGEQHTPAAVPA
eukprot:6997633-Alexandrium_andersonii.AAC.1